MPLKKSRIKFVSSGRRQKKLGRRRKKNLSRRREYGIIICLA